MRCIRSLPDGTVLGHGEDWQAIPQETRQAAFVVLHLPLTGMTAWVSRTPKLYLGNTHCANKVYNLLKYKTITYMY